MTFSRGRPQFPHGVDMGWVERAAEITWGDARRESVVVIGGGPSISRVPTDLIAESPAVCCNDAYRLRRRRSLVVAMDRRWVSWNRHQLSGSGHVLLTQKTPSPVGEAYYFEREREKVVSDVPTHLPGLDTGYAAVNAAYLLGARTIILAGYDMRFSDGRSHWHEGHRIPTAEGQYKTRFLPQYFALVRELDARGVRVTHLPGCAAIGEPMRFDEARELVEGR